ncbi:MAG: NAD-dependent epimerase/dehydratase family protein [Desulfomonilaceae bacterium]
MKWLITGGCGFIGKNLVRRLCEEGGHYVRVVDNLSVGTVRDLAEVCSLLERSQQDVEPMAFQKNLQVVELIKGDILNESLATKACQGAEAIVHLAACTGVPASVEDPRKDCVNNVMGTLNYLEAARRNGVKRFIFASSGAPVGECEPPIHEEIPPHPVSPYGASKLAGEAYCSAYFRTYGVETVALRFGNVYGPGSGHKTSVVAKFIRRAMSREPIEIYGDGNQSRDFIYIDDLIRAVRLAAEVDGIGGETFQIATARETTVGELVGHLIPILEDFGLTNLEILHREPRLGDVERNFSNTIKAANMLGWKARHSLEQGLRCTASDFIKRIV